MEVKKTKINFLDFEIDRLTRSIENVATGDSFPTDGFAFSQSRS